MRKFRATLRYLYLLAMRLAAWCILTPVYFVILMCHRRLFDAPLVMPFYTHSFGHSVMALDFTARLYARYDISLVMVRDPRATFYLPRMFQGLTLYWVPAMGFSPTTGIAVLRTLMYFICPLVGKGTLIEWRSVYRALSLLPERLVANEEEDRLIPVPWDNTGYAYLLEHDIGPRPSLPPELIERSRSYIAANHPDFFSRPFITLLLRAKGQDDPAMSARFRSAGPAENYRAAVIHAVARGYHVVGTGETAPAVFADIPGFFDLGDIPGAPGLMNLFLLSNCALFWGQQSGPYVLPNACGIPCLITDSLPHRHGTFGPGAKDIILHKPLTLAGQETPLDLVAIYTRHADLAHGYGFARKGVTIGCNNSQDLLRAMEEALDRLHGPAAPDVAALADRLRELMEPSMPSRYHSSRPPEFVLRSLPLE